MADRKPTIVLRVELEDKYLKRLREECPDAEYVVAADDAAPLPADSPLWDLPNALITGHTAAATPLLWERGIELVIDNVRRFLGGEELRNVVNTKAGY
jgi:phosphoglycerate dehydrogenase-like enzyme